MQEQVCRSPAPSHLIAGWQMTQRQALSLEIKELLTARRIESWYRYWNGRVYVSFSGGKDSTVLLDMVRKIYPDVVAVFVDTGLEYSEIRSFVKTIENVVWLKPAMTFKQVIDKYGYPVISKQVSMGLSRYANTKSKLQKELRLNGGICPTSGKKQNRTIPIKWHFMINAPFKCSEVCCTIMKKNPAKKYAKTTGRKPFIGTMADESNLRKMDYLKRGCNAFSLKEPTSTPLAFWAEKDIWDYIKKYKLPYSEIYDMGEKRTGCKYCMYGIHMEKEPNRFQRMEHRTPSQYEYGIDRLGCGQVMDYMGVNYKL